MFTPWLILHHGMSFMKVQKTHLETLNMGLGVHGRRPHMASRDLHRGDLAQVYGFWFITKNKQIFESCLCQTNSRWFFRHLSLYQNNILTCIWLLLQLIKEIKLCLTTKLSRISRLSFYDQCFRSGQGQSPENSRHLPGTTGPGPTKKLKILDHILVHFGIFCRGLCEPYYSL